MMYTKCHANPSSETEVKREGQTDRQRFLLYRFVWCPGDLRQDLSKCLVTQIVTPLGTLVPYNE